MEPSPEEAAEGSILVKVLSAVLERLVCSNTLIAKSDPGQITKFHALKAPGIGVEAYLERVQRYASCSNECFILALIYIDRLIERNNFLLTELNVHRVVITAILLAAKFFDDAYYNNAYYAKVGGVLVNELNGLEVDFLFRINFSLHVSPVVFEKYKAELVAHSINLGFAVDRSATFPHPHRLPHISGKKSQSTFDSLKTSMAESEFSRNQQQFEQHHQTKHHNECSFPNENQKNDTCSQIASLAPKQVTPSPSISSENIVDIANSNGNIVIDSKNYVTANEPAVPAVVRTQPQFMDQLNATVSVVSAQYQQLQVSTSSNSNKIIPHYQQEQLHQHHQQQSILLQRANSLPLVSSNSCVDHAFKLPYSAPPMPHVLAAVNQEKYQLMMNQLFPIENTLIHHNHHVVGGSKSSSNFFPHQHLGNTAAVAGLVGHHQGSGVSHRVQGSGLASMACQVNLSG